MATKEMKARILNYVSSYLDSNGFAPTYREIGSAVGLHSPSTVHWYIKALTEEGRLDMRANHPRAIALHRRIPMKAEEPQRLRIELSDGGIFFVDCSVKHTSGDHLSVVLSGIMDASHLKGSISSIVGCTIESA